MSPDLQGSPPEAASTLLLWAGCLAGPLGWFLQLEVTYAIAAGSGAGSVRPWLHLVSLLCLLLVAGGAWAAWRGWGVAGREWPAVSDEGISARARFLGVLGLMTCLLCAVVMVAQWIAVLVLDTHPL